MINKPAILFLAQRLPYPPVKGEKITSYNLVRHLSRKYRVFVGTFIDDEADLAHVEPFRKMVTGLHVEQLERPWSLMKAFPRWILGEPLTFAVFRSAKLHEWVRSVARDESPVAIVTHSSNISTYAVDTAIAAATRRPKSFLHFADVDSEKFVDYAARASGVKRWLFTTEARRVLREERRLTSLADNVAFVSDEEAALFRKKLKSGAEKVVTLPNGVDTAMFDPTILHSAPFVAQGAAFVFTGAMDYLPNVEAVEWFAEQVFPGIRRQLPHAQFLIVGSKPADRVQRLSAIDGVIVTGRVDSVAAYQSHSQVAVAPLKIARGIQNKVLESMAMAMPTVVSPGALTGIAATDGVEVLVAESPEQWVQACVCLVRDAALARRIGDSARVLVKREYDWEAQFAKLDRFLGIEDAVPS